MSAGIAIRDVASHSLLPRSIFTAAPHSIAHVSASVSPAGGVARTDCAARPDASLEQVRRFFAPPEASLERVNEWCRDVKTPNGFLCSGEFSDCLGRREYLRLSRAKLPWEGRFEASGAVDGADRELTAVGADDLACYE